MKRLTIVAMLLVGAVLTAQGQEQKAILASCSKTTNVVKWTYTVSNGGVVLRGRGRRAVPENTSGELVIPEKIDGKPVCSIGDHAFAGCSGLTSVTIPSSVTNIEYRAFARCIGLTSVTIPSSVTSIGDYAFCGCSGLASVTISSRVPRLGKGAFSQCPKLTSVCVVRDGWEDQQLTIGEFEDWARRRRSISCSKEKNLRTWRDPETGVTWCFSVDRDGAASLDLGFSFSKDMPTLVGDVVVPESIDGHAVTDIRGLGKDDRIDLTSLRIPKTVRQLSINSASIFTLTNVTIEAGCEEYRSDGRFIFERRFVLEKANAKHDGSVAPRLSKRTSRYSRLRHVCAGGTKRLVIPEGVETIGWGCISGASWLEEVRIPSTVKEVDASAFTGCKGLVRRYDPDGKGYMVIDGWLIPYEPDAYRVINGRRTPCRAIQGLDWEVPAGVRHIANCGLRTELWQNVTSVKLPEGLASIGQWAFDGSRVETVVLPSSLERCSGFQGVKHVVFNSGKTDFPMPNMVTNVTYNAGVTEISARCNGEAVKSIQLPSGLISIAKGSLDYLPNLTEIVIPATVTNIGCSVFSECPKLKSVGVEKDGKVEYVPIEAFRRKWNLRFPDGCLHLTDAKTVIRWIVSEGAPYRAGSVCTLVGIEDGQDPSALTIPETIAGMSVVRVDWDYFLQSKSRSWRTEATSDAPPARTNALSAVELRIPRTLEYVDLSAVARIFPNLQSLVVEEGGDKYSSSDGVLCESGTAAYCPRNRKGRVVLGEGIWRIGQNAFRNCTNLTEVVLPASLRAIDSGAFSECLTLQSLDVSPENPCFQSIDGVIYTKDGRCLQTWPGGKRSVAVRTGVEIVGTGAFCGCSAMEKIDLPTTVTNIGFSAFKGCTSLRSLYIPDGVEHIGDCAFGECRRLLTLRLPATLQTMGMLAWPGGCVPERILTAPGDAERIFELLHGRASGRPDSDRRRFVVEGDALVRATNGFARWRDPETGIAWLYSVQDDKAVVERTEFLKGYEGHLEVPALLGGKQVSDLHWLYDGRGITSLSLPMSVTNINPQVLAPCEKLQFVKMNVDGELKTIATEGLRKQWKAQREAKRAEARKHLLAIHEELRRVREAKAAAEEKQKGK